MYYAKLLSVLRQAMGVGRTHARGGTLDLLMTDIPDVIRVVEEVPAHR